MTETSRPRTPFTSGTQKFKKGGLQLLNKSK
nr:MAG TPA: hypothetical protein [Caudoviricetes sp.]